MNDSSNNKLADEPADEPADAPAGRLGAADYRLSRISLDDASLPALSADVAHERDIAIFDLLEDNSFKPMNSTGGPYSLHLGVEENRLVFDIRTQTEAPHGKIMMSLAPLRRLIKDYYLVCESYFEAIKTSTPAQIEAIDMGRRGLHNEASEFLQERLAGKIDIDFNTARRLFTLICALHNKG